MAEDRAALLLCPGHELASQLSATLAVAEQVYPLRLTGGQVLVGSEAQPGTYYVENVDGCYWDRLDAAGNTIENNFIVSAPRAEVTIAPSDYAFSWEGCGIWLPTWIEIPDGMIADR